jgi:chemotaxis protein MotA
MIGIVGIIVVFVAVFGGYMLAGGNLAIVMHSLPFEMLIILGAAIGAYVVSNDLTTVRKTFGDMRKVFQGPQWLAQDYQDLLVLMFSLIRISRQNPLELEEHIEDPQNSVLFNRFPRILTDAEAVDLICDTMRAAGMNYDDPHQVQEILENRIEAGYRHSLHTSHALQTMADGLPALGIVAAVLGVIKTMGSIDQPPEVLGSMIGGALVGTFLGVFLAYGLVGPLSARIRSIVEEDQHFYGLIREVMVANLFRHPPNICVEVGRQNTPHAKRPSFNELDEALRSGKSEVAA